MRRSQPAGLARRLEGSLQATCSQLVVAGRTGILVAGGMDSNLAPTNTVEFLDLGESPGSSLQWTRLRWRNLPELSRPRAHLVIVRRQQISPSNLGNNTF